ncbi:MAG: RNA polymerase sigma factor [Bryobacterales bacterium]|nr:RNA polymerase sigma factor [Opitutaceae bacterium]MCZ2156602.1 RNA polymerase sigma factor [Bryobacterales bacterium]
MSSQDLETARWFEEEVRPHANALRAWLRARFPSLVDPDDLVQESYLRLLRARGAGAIANTRAFLFTTARNVALDLVRRNRVVSTEPLVSGEPSYVLAEGSDVAEQVSRSQEIEILREAIRQLPARCREIMTLQRIQGLSNRQIAERLGLSIHTVNAQMVIGLMRCRTYLSERGVLGRVP